MSNISPLLQKGAILSLDPTTGIPLGKIMLQYNPDTLTRSLKPQTVGDEPDRTEIMRLKGPPVETIKCDVEIDATDQLASGDSTAMSLGIQPQLSSLELLVYPSSAVLIANEVLSLLGTVEILPMESALTVFVWNKNRITPVRITDLSITEEAFDPQLESHSRESIARHARAQRKRRGLPHARRRALHDLSNHQGRDGRLNMKKGIAIYG